MAAEIERKFLVRGDGWRSLIRDRCDITQVYLASTGHLTIRVRMETPGTATLNLKTAAAGIERQEFEYEIPAGDALELMRNGLGSPIRKTRHTVLIAGLSWQIDEFAGDNAGLIVAEIELQSADQVIVPPDWLGAEVSHDKRYYNSALAERPFRLW
jgi:adenylate cyclase